MKFCGPEHYTFELQKGRRKSRGGEEAGVILRVKQGKSRKRKQPKGKEKNLKNWFEGLSWGEGIQGNDKKSA